MRPEAAIGIGILGSMVAYSSFESNTSVIVQEQTLVLPSEQALLELAEYSSETPISNGETPIDEHTPDSYTVQKEAAFLTTGGTIFEPRAQIAQFQIPKVLGLGAASPAHTESRVLHQPQIRSSLNLKVKSYH